ncbi:MAG: PAAR domain-containing protein [Armatimonadota bacterium]
MAQVARLGDTSSHGGTIISASETVFVNGIAVARVGDLHSCPVPGHGITPVVTGSSVAFSGGKAIARIGDTAGCGAVINSGSPDAEAG